MNHWSEPPRPAQPFGGRTEFHDRWVGEVCGWKGKFGFIMPETPIPHPSVISKGGKLFFHKTDTDPSLEIKPGMKIAFCLYEDERGLGAHRVSSTLVAEPERNVHLLVDAHFVGALIGPKGANIKKMQKESGVKSCLVSRMEVLNSQGAVMPLRMLSVSGESDAIDKACGALGKFLSEHSQNLNMRIAWACPCTMVGKIIGKKGSNMKKLQQKYKSVKLDIQRERLFSQGNEFQQMVAFGPMEETKKMATEVNAMLVAMA